MFALQEPQEVSLDCGEDGPSHHTIHALALEGHDLLARGQQDLYGRAAEFREDGEYTSKFSS